MDRLKSGVIATYATYLIQGIIALFVAPIIIDKLGQSLYGVYEIAMAISAYLGILNFGIPHSFLRFSALERERLKTNRTDSLNRVYFSTVFLLSIFALLIGLLIANFGMPLFSHKLTAEELKLCKNATILLSVNAAIGIFSSAFDSYMLSFERYATNKVIGCCKAVLTSGLSVTALFLGYSLNGVLIATVLVSLGGLMFTAIYCYKHLELRLRRDKNETYPIGPILSYSVFIFINLIADQVNWSIDRVLLGGMSGTVSTAIYGVGARLHNIFMQVMIAISGVFVARIYTICAEKSADQNRKLNEMFILVGRLQFMLAGIIIIGFSLFGKQFIAMWVGPEYAKSYYVALILILCSTHLYIQNVATEIQRAKNLHKFRSFIYILMSVINLVLSIVLIQRIGEIGAAAGTAVSLVIGDGIIINIYYQKKVGLNVIEFWKRILRLGVSFLPSFVLGVLMNYLIKPSSFVACIPQMIVVIVTYGLGVFLLGLRKTEREVFVSRVRNIFMKGKTV